MNKNIKKIKNNKINLKKNEKLRNKLNNIGFSLLEVVAFIAIVTLCILALASVYYSIIKMHNKVMYNDLIAKKTQTYFNLYIENKRELYLKVSTLSELASKLNDYANYLISKLNKDNDLENIVITSIYANPIESSSEVQNALTNVYLQKQNQMLYKFYIKLTINYKIKGKDNENKVETFLPVFVEKETTSFLPNYTEITINTTGGSGGSTTTSTMENTLPPGTVPSSGVCFELLSLVLVKEGDNYKLKRMGDVKIGDIIITVDPVENYKLKEIEVEKIHMHDKKEYEILEIITENSKLRLTPNHPLVIDKNNNIKKAEKLNIGDKVLVYQNGDYSWQEIKQIRKEKIIDKVMTLELKGNINTFLVSADGKSFILAHSGYRKLNLIDVMAFSSLSFIVAVAWAHKGGGGEYMPGGK